MSNGDRKSRLLLGSPYLAAPWGNPVPEHAPTYTLDRQIAQARHDMGEARWKQLNEEWEAKP